MKSVCVKIIAIVGLFLSSASCANADTYDVATGQLTIPSVSVGATTYTNVVVTLGSLISVGSGAAVGTVDSYDAATNQLTIPSVLVGATTYTNVVITVGSVVSVGGTLPTLMTTSTVQRDQQLSPATTGAFNVGSSNIEINATLVGAGRTANDYLSGLDIGGSDYYLSSILANGADAFQFNINVPNDNTLYGVDAGTTVPYVGLLLYPTATTNIRPDYAFNNFPIVPKMQGAGQLPVFENATAKYPLIILSHGRGNQAMATNVMAPAKLLASHGYIVCLLFHGDNRFPVFDGVNLNSMQDIALRPLAVKSAIDQLSNPATVFGAMFNSHIDFTKIGGVGESYGGATMAALHGAKAIGPSFALTRQLTTDPRIIASANIVPYFGPAGGGLFGINHAGISFASSTVPYMAVTGSVDPLTSQSDYNSALTQFSGVRYLISVAGEGHNFSVTAYNDAYTWLLQFLNAFVKGDAAARSALESADSVAGGSVDSVL